LAKADGLMHNMRPDAANRVGIDYARVREISPQIVYLYAASYGSSGPGAGRAAFHPIMGALSGGVLRQIGRGNEPLVDEVLSEDQTFETALRLINTNEASPDITGALGVGTALAMALYHKVRTGEGQYLETTMFGSNLYKCSEDAIRYAGRPPLPEVDRLVRGTGALHRLYQAAQGWVFVGCELQAEWEGLCQVFDHPEWRSDSRFETEESRRRFDDQLTAEIGEAIKTRSASDWEKVSLDHDVPLVRADEYDGDDFFLGHPQSLENQIVVEASLTGIAPHRRANCMVNFSLTPGVANIAHEFGDDGPAIMTELGYDDATVSSLVRSGILVVPSS
ncbi:MAG TPA: CoA transferase, partial [Acidimicrobiales bacterium]|nr:CoA transferase [Acidimicrobiales bacterium]